MRCISTGTFSLVSKVGLLRLTFPLFVVCTASCSGNNDATSDATGGAQSGTDSTGGTSATGNATAGGVAGMPASSSASSGGENASWSQPTFDPNALPTSIPSVSLIIDDAARETLEAAPFYGDDAAGAFVDGDGHRYETVNVNYRGAYALQSLMENDPLGRRNWKVKFPSDNRYRNRREWNYTFSPNLRQLLAWDLMRFAGVPVPSARPVRLSVNDEPQGLYLEYEDPDNKDWLWDMFGDKEGDLYKAALDVPESEGQPEQKYFADTTYLGNDDASYRNHYSKKTNHKDPTVADDYQSLRAFLEALNTLPDSEILSWATSHLQLERFTSYLVVSNFIANWDSFPQRPKNFWLYEVRSEGKLAFIPWDLDGTFQESKDRFNQMGTDASIFFNLLALEYEPIHPEEGTERPLAWRLMAQPEFEATYLARYRQLAESILSEPYLIARIDALASLVAPQLSDAATGEDRFGTPTTERSDFEDALADVRGFVSARASAVASELAASP